MNEVERFHIIHQKSTEIIRAWHAHKFEKKWFYAIKGSIVFRDEEDYVTRAKDPKAFFEGVIQPFKAELEIWYNNHKSTWVDFQIIFLTAWAILKPQNELVYSVFKDLPQKDMEKELEKFNAELV